MADQSTPSSGTDAQSSPKSVFAELAAKEVTAELVSKESEHRLSEAQTRADHERELEKLRVKHQQEEQTKDGDLHRAEAAKDLNHNRNIESGILIFLAVSFVVFNIVFGLILVYSKDDDLKGISTTLLSAIDTGAISAALGYLAGRGGKSGVRP